MKTLLKIFIVSLPLFLSGIIISQDHEEPEERIREQDYQITFFEPKDLSRDAFLTAVRTKDPALFMSELKEKKWGIRLEVKRTPRRKKKTDVVEAKKVVVFADVLGHFIKLDNEDPKQVNFEVGVYSKLDAGDAIVHLVRIDGKEEIFDTYETIIPERFADPGRQPLIYSITPEAGKRGDTITVKGRNFGSDIDNITIYFGENQDDSAEGFVESMDRKPLSVSQPNEDKEQELKFHIPTRVKFQDNFSYRKKFFFKISVGGRPTGLHEVVVLSNSWKYWIGSLSVFMLFLMYLGLAYILKKFDFLDMILIDKATNTYSLSRFQAMIWTVVLLGGYFYIAISNGLLLGNGTIPDFNPSLIGLLSISYIGMIGANGVGSKKPKNEIISLPPQLSNLFSSGGSIDLARLQLFGFTVVGVIIYVYNLINTNPLNGLPDIPTTLLGLMGVSQSGYLGGKVIGDKAVVNMVRPHYIPANKDGLILQLVGAGFVKNTKVLVDEINEPLETTFVSSTALSVKIPALYGLGKKSLTLLPNDSTSIAVENCFEVILVEPNEVPANAGSTISVNIVGLDDSYKLTIYGDSEEEYEPLATRNTNEGIQIDLPPLLPGAKWFTFNNPETGRNIEIENALDVYPMDDSFIDPDTEPPEGWDEDDDSDGDEDGGEPVDDGSGDENGGNGGSGTISFETSDLEQEQEQSEVEEIKPSPKRRKSPSSATFNVTEFTINP